MLFLAIKKCRWDYLQLTPAQCKRWTHEVDIMKRLKHPNIVKAGTLPFKLPDTVDNLPVLCMEYCRKGDLRKVCIIYYINSVYLVYTMK